jgi:hypothetical protein
MKEELFELKEKKSKIQRELNWLAEEEETRRRKKWYIGMIISTVLFWTVVLGSGIGGLILIGFLIPDVDARIIIIVLSMMFYVVALVGIFIGSTERFAIWFLRDSPSYSDFARAFNRWYVMVICGRKDEYESDYERYKRLKKEKKQMEEFLSFYERLENDPDFRESFLKL